MTPQQAYHERAPSPDAASVVLSYWAFHASAAAEPTTITVWPDGCMSLVAVVAAGRVQRVSCLGPSAVAKSIPVSPGTMYIGIRFWPDTGGAFLHVLPAAHRDGGFDVPAHVKPSWAACADLLARCTEPPHAWPLLDAWLATQLPMVVPDPSVREALRRIAAACGSVRVPDVARVVGVGLRTLQRRFAIRTGLSLKEYARVRRLRTALGVRVQEGGEGWAALAARLGYADQAHLVREFNALAGTTPRAADRVLQRIAHHDVRA